MSSAIERRAVATRRAEPGVWRRDPRARLFPFVVMAVFAALFVLGAGDGDRPVPAGNGRALAGLWSAPAGHLVRRETWLRERALEGAGRPF